MNKFYFKRPNGSLVRNLSLKTLALVATLLPLSSIAQDWQNVGTASRISTGGSSFTNLAKDQNGNLYVSYYDVGVAKGSVQKFDGTTWSYLGNQGITTGIATFNALAVKDAQNIYYSNQGSSAMNVRKFDGSSWSSLPDSESTTINTQSLAVDASGVVYAVSGASSGRVKRYVNGVWEQVGTSGFTNASPAFINIKAGTNGKIYVSFNNNGYVNVYQNDANASDTQAWTPVGAASNVATASSSENYNSSLAIDSNNNLYLAYIAGQKLNVKKFNGTWTTLGNENFSIGRAQFVSIAVNSAGIPYVVCSNWEDDNFLKNYAYGFDGQNWVRMGGLISSGEARYNSLIVDQNDDLVLAYSDSGNGIVVKKFEIINPIATYCEVSFPQSAEPISQVTFAGINNSSVATITSETPQYEDFTTVFGQVTKGNTYPISISGFNPANTIGNFANHIAVYFDWNRNGSFDDAGETYYLGYMQGNAAVSTITGNIQVPANASLGNTRMRVVKKYYTNTNATSVPSACNATGYGQAEDYTITVYDQEPVAVENVSVATLNNAAPQIATLGGTLQLIATVTPTNSNQNVTWSISQGTEFATISASGLVTATANGTIIAKATSAESATLFGTKEITITNQAVPATCTFATLSLTGFNADVIAEGNGNADTKTSSIVDAANVFYAKDFVPANPHSSGASATAFGGGLPNNGTVESSATQGLSYQFANYTQNNALVLRNSLTNTGILMLNDAKKASKIYIAAVAAEGNNTVNVVVNFEDNTSESFAFQATDWWQTSAPSNKIINGIGRVSRGASWAPLNQFDGLTQTGIYQNELELSAANHNKTITSLTFTQTPPSGNATTTTILAVSVCETPQPANGPVVITSGFNHDIIANGVGNASASTTVGFDEANTRALVSLDFKATVSSNAPSFGLPANGTINSAKTAGVIFQLANYTGQNALFLTPSHVGNNAQNNGTLEFSASNAGKLYVLAAAASGGSNSLTFNTVVNFNDGTTQAINNVAISDWYGGQNTAIQGIGRVNTTNNNLEGDVTNPRLYEIALNLEEQNQSKTITGVQFSFSGDANAEYASQIRMSVLAITTAEATSNESSLVVSTLNNVLATITSSQGILELNASLNGEQVNYTNLIWTVEEGETFANVDTFGRVTAMSNGTATIRATLASDATVFGEINIVISGQSDGYCEAYFINGCDEYTSIVSVNTTGGSAQIANSHSGCSNDNGLSGYGNFTAQKAVAKRNDSVEFTVNFSGATSYLSVWIDWNQDFVFSNSERVYVSTDAEATTATTFTVNVPDDAVLGETRIRIKAVNGWEGSGACGYNSFGEVEDYTFEVEESLGIDDFATKNLKIYPNPTFDFATIQSTETIKEVTIFNMIGQQISKTGSSTINLSNVEQGVYLVHIQFENGKTASQKLVKK